MGICLLPGVLPASRRLESDPRFRGTLEHVVPIVRDKFRWWPHENESIDAGHSGEVASSNDEGS